MAAYDLVVIPLGGGAPLAGFSDDHAGDERMAATVDRVSWVLNQPGSMSFTAPLDHPATAAAQLLRTEVELYRDGLLIWRGIPLQRDRTGSAAAFTCAGLLWPFTRWHVGPDVDDLVDGLLRFERTGLQGWTPEGLIEAQGVSDVVREGHQAARLRAPGANEDGFIATTFVVADTGSDGEYIEAAADYFIDPGAWEGPAFDERGLYLESPDSLPDGFPSWEPITHSSPRGQWVRATTGIHLPPNRLNHPVFLRCYAVQGRIWWDNGVVRRQRSVSADQAVGTDAAAMFRRLVDYALTEKTDLGLSLDTPPAGVRIRDVYQFHELANVFTLMESYPARGLLDFAVEGRTLVTFAPRRGIYRSDRPLTVSTESTALNYEHRADGAATTTRVIRTGQGADTTRDIFTATDTSRTGGLVLEDVATVPSEFTPADAEAMAATELHANRDVVTVPSLQVPAAGWLGVLIEGDTTDVTIDHGAIVESSQRRVVGVHLDPRTDTVVYDLGAVEPVAAQ